MVCDAQVLLLRKKLMTTTQEAAAAAAGMSVRTARRWQKGGLPSARKRRYRRTLPAPFVEVWATEVVPILEQDKKGEGQATIGRPWSARNHLEGIHACASRYRPPSADMLNPPPPPPVSQR